jgi:metal-responsive CopG/Arc/MetJ family transcriptional regulator
MDKNTAKIMCYTALDDIEKAIRYYQSTPNAKNEVTQKRKGYLEAITRYINTLETDLVDAKFNTDIFVMSDNTNAFARLQAAQRRIAELETMLEAVGVDIHTQKHMKPDMPEMKRMNSINRAKELWPELY